MAASSRTLLCDPCTKRGETNIATGYCSECREMYCCHCKKHHKASWDTKTHKYVIFDSIEEKSDRVDCDTCRETENKHIWATYLCGKCRQLYCKQCKLLHCFLKNTSDHDLFEINFAVPERTFCKDSFNFTSDFEKFILSDMSISGSGSVLKPSARIDSVNFTSDVENFTLTDKSIADSGSDSYQAQNDYVNSSDFEGFDSIQDESDLSTLLSVFRTSSGKFKIGLKKEGMEKLSAKIIGTLSAKNTQSVKRSFISSRINLRVDSERDADDCWFRGIICLKDGRLLLLDSNNYVLTMFDEYYNIVSTEPTRVKGLGMTKVSEEEIAMVTDDSVYFYKVNKNRFKLKKQGNINLGSEGSGISYNRGMFAVLCDVKKEDPIIKIYSATGEEIFTIKCEPAFIINLDSEEDRIYASTSSLHSALSCISENGKLLWKYDFCGQDVVEFYNCLLVTDLKNSAIILCSKDGKYRKTLIQDEERLYGAEYLAYNPDTQQLYVTRLFENDVTIIQLQSNLF